MDNYDFCNNWECPFNKDGKCVATPEERDICLDELLIAVKKIKKSLDK